MKLGLIKKLIWRREPTLPNNAMPFDGMMLSSIGFLVLLGFVSVTSASLEVASEKYGNPYFFMVRHGAYVALALIAAILVWRVPTQRWNSWSPIIMIGAAVLLVLVLLVGRKINGSTRWIPLGVMNFQPSELAKLAMVLYVAGYLLRRSFEVRNYFSGILIPMIPLMFYVLLLALEPDYGALVLISATVIVMVFLGGMGVLHASALFLATVVVMIGVFYTNESYRLDRIESYLDPWAQAFAGGYQQVQAQIAFGRGEWFGAGLGNSVQKLLFLPEAHTDFVMSVIAEELGYLGAVALIVAYVVMVFRMYLLGRRAEVSGDLFSAYVVYGIATLLAGQALINIGVNVGAIPPKGITLPLVSYGGSSMLTTAVMLAIVMRIDFEMRVTRINTAPTAQPTEVDVKEQEPLINQPTVASRKDFASMVNIKTERQSVQRTA